jgi:hypothetical protein
MPRFPEAHALMEQALRHVLAEQQKILKRPDSNELIPVLSSLCGLAIKTGTMLADGFNRVNSTSHLTREAREIETIVDDLSESLWRPIQVSVSSIYERIEKSLKPKPGEHGFVAEVRSHYHNIRLRLLEQMLGARMLALSSDLGNETERIWQQFLEQHLGPMFRVLRGGYICDHQGNKSCQVDLIVVPAFAQVFVPGDSKGGKAHVLVDQVISAIMVTSNLTTEKLKSDWRKLQSLPRFPDQDKDYPHLKGHPWPFCYILAAQSDSAEDLKEAWCELCRGGVTAVVPQFVIALDTGFMFCGLRKWPAPRFPGNYVEADDVHTETGIRSGLGLAWLIAQNQGRLAAIQGQALGHINRFARLLDRASMHESVPATYSPRFNTFFKMVPIAGIIEWGSAVCWAHNRLELWSVVRKKSDTKTRWDIELLKPGVDPATLDHRSYTKFLRWFRYGATVHAGRLVAIEEWINHGSKTGHKRRIVVFDTISGEEITGPLVDGLTAVSEVTRIQASVEASLPSADRIVCKVNPAS